MNDEENNKSSLNNEVKMNDKEEGETSLNNEVKLEDANNDDTDKTPDDNDDDVLPIDRGWAWVIAIATQLNQMLKIGYKRSMGILFIEFLRVFKASITETSLISGVQAGVLGFSVFVSMQILVGKLPVRLIVALGGTLSAIGIMSCAFATEIQQVVILQAIFIGIGNSMIHGPGLVLVGQYFKKKRGIGTAISNSGVSAGAVIVPPIVKLLLDYYGLQGTLLIIGAIELNVVVFACLMRPLDSFKRNPNTVKIDNTESTVPQVRKENIKIKKRKANLEYIISEKESMRRNRKEIIIGENNPHNKEQFSPMIKKRTRLRTESESSRVSLFTSQEDVYSVILDNDDTKDSEQKKTWNPCKSLDFTVWKQPHFLMMAFNTFCGNFAILFLSYYPAHVVETGTSKNDATLFLSISGGIDFFARLLAGYIADRGCFRRTHICVFSLFVTALNCHCIRFYDSYGLQLLGTIVYGIFGGIFNSFTALLLMDFLGSDNLARSLGFIMILNGVAVSIYHPAVGALRDSTGSFIPAYDFMGTLLSLAAMMLLIEPYIARCAKRMQNKLDTEDQ